MVSFVKTSLLKEGMQNIKNIYDENGRILLRKGNHLTQNAIRVIQEKGYRGLYIEDNNSHQQTPLPEPLIEDVELIRIATILMALYARKEIIRDPYDEFYVKHIKTLYDELDSLIDILFEAYREQRLIFELSDGRNRSNWLYFHCVNTCLLAIAIGIVEGKTRNLIKDTALAALLHDMGKAWYADSLVNQEKLDNKDKEEIKGHVDNIYRLLQQHNYSIDVLQGVREHHEKVDGSGYPYGLNGERMFDSAKIIAVANAYDNLTSINPYGDEKLIESEAINYLSVVGQYDQEAINALVKVVARYPVGTRVLLSNGVSGTVVKNNMGYPERPAVATNSGVIELTDMSKYSAVTVTSVLNDVVLL